MIDLLCYLKKNYKDTNKYKNNFAFMGMSEFKIRTQ